MASKKKAAAKKKPARKIEGPPMAVKSKPIMVTRGKAKPKTGPSRLSGPSRSLDPWDR